MTTTVTLIPGDGIGPEVVESARRVVEATGVELDWDVQHAGAAVFRKGIASGVPAETIESIRRNRVALKGPLETPVGFGEKSANVTLRKLFETFGNLRPVREFPGVTTPYSGRRLDLVVVRENVEDLYAGIEHQQTSSVAQCLKLMSREGCERISRLAFEVAKAEGRTQVHCATKANIMKLTEGLLKRTFEEVAADYPGIEAHHIIIDNCAHQLVKRPEQFEVIVTSNMNGDIISDLTSALVGGLGFAPSANLGTDVAIFEAVHGSAPKYAGLDVINPTAVILSAAMMLRHLGETNAAAAVEDAVNATVASACLTRDVAGGEGTVSTSAYTDKVIANLGAQVAGWARVPHQPVHVPRVETRSEALSVQRRRVDGADVFVEWHGSADALAASLRELVQSEPLRLKMISNRGTQVWPSTGGETSCVDHWRCRFIAREEGCHVSDAVIQSILTRLSVSHRWMHLEKLNVFDGEAGYTKAQGED
jgi:isocitrate dehydrogenase